MSIKDKKRLKGILVYKKKFSCFPKKFLANIFDLEFLISVLQESPLCLKYVLFIGFVVSPMYNIVKTYKEKKYNNALEFVYKLYENRDVYRIKPYGVLSIIVIVDLIRKIKSFF